jgi:hypothetical protein
MRAWSFHRWRVPTETPLSFETFLTRSPATRRSQIAYLRQRPSAVHQSQIVPVGAAEIVGRNAGRIRRGRVPQEIAYDLLSGIIYRGWKS